MSDDDSESDIETMFQDAHNNIVRKTDEHYDDDDDDSDISDNDDNKTKAAHDAPHQFYHPTKKRKKSVVDKKLEQVSQRQAKQQEIDKVNSRKQKRIDNDDDDDDDFLDDDDDVKILGTTSATTTTTRNGATTRSATTSTITAKPPNYVEPSTTLLDSDDDEDDSDRGKAGVVTKGYLAPTTAINLMYPPNSNTLPPSYPYNFINNISSGTQLYQQQQQIPIVMNPFHAAMIRGRVVPDMILPPSMNNPNQPKPNLQPHLLSSIPMQQQYRQQELLLKSKVANIMNTIDVDEISASNQSNSPQLLRIKVIATIIPNHGSSLPVPSLVGLPVVDLTSDDPASSSVPQIKGSRTVSCMVDIIETSTIQALMDRILQHYLHLNLKQNVIGLQYNNEPLYSKHTLDMYLIPASGATIIATVHSSDNTAIPNNAGNGSNIASGNATRSVNASSFATNKPKAHVPKGTAINLLLRRSWTVNGKTSSEEISMTIGNLDPLEVLVEKYRQHSMKTSTNNNCHQKITLQFDGDTVLLERTPKQYDMENDDLIDVIVT